jgi:hypothetical protein
MTQPCCLTKEYWTRHVVLCFYHDLYLFNRSTLIVSSVDRHHWNTWDHRNQFGDTESGGLLLVIQHWPIHVDVHPLNFLVDKLQGKAWAPSSIFFSTIQEDRTKPATCYCLQIEGSLLVVIIMFYNVLLGFSIDPPYFGYNSAGQENHILRIFKF